MGEFRAEWLKEQLKKVGSVYYSEKMTTFNNLLFSLLLLFPLFESVEAQETPQLRGVRELYGTLFDYEASHGAFPDSLADVAKPDGFSRYRYLYLGRGQTLESNSSRPILLVKQPSAKLWISLLLDGSVNMVSEENLWTQFSTLAGSADGKVFVIQDYSVERFFEKYGEFIVGGLGFFLIAMSVARDLKKPLLSFCRIAGLVFILLSLFTNFTSGFCASMIKKQEFEETVAVVKHAQSALMHFVTEEDSSLTYRYSPQSVLPPSIVSSFKQTGWGQSAPWIFLREEDTYSDKDPKVAVFMSPVPIGGKWVVGMSDTSVESVSEDKLFHLLRL